MQKRWLSVLRQLKKEAITMSNYNKTPELKNRLIFEISQPGRYIRSLVEEITDNLDDIPQSLKREDTPLLPEVSELDVVRHFTRLANQNFSVDTHFYPLGSCTMKYNPKVAHVLASLNAFQRLHPLIHPKYHQGLLMCLYELQEALKKITGMSAASLTPMAGAQGEFAGVAMIKAYHALKGDHQRCEMLIPDAAHGTNPASAAMCNFIVREVPTAADGDMDLNALRAMLGPKTAGIMLTNPSTLGVFERKILDISKMVHDSGGLLYYDGANLNAILGKVKPGDMGFDVIHLNVHKTFATPHGAGGPGSGPILANDRLKPFLPIPFVIKNKESYRWVYQKELPDTIGQLSAFMGNIGVLLRAYVYIKLLGGAGLSRVGDYATLNANYLMVRLKEAGFTIQFPKRRTSHEFIVTLAPVTKQYGITANDFAKRLLDYGFHAPTIYFPLLVPECLLIEPTETESLETMDRFVDAMVAILDEAKINSALVKAAPHTMPVKRLDAVKAARELNAVWREK
jgi:glycine dehydrogenase subunit 2